MRASVAVKDLADRPLGQLAGDLSIARPESESGFLLLDSGPDALAWRLFMADNAAGSDATNYPPGYSDVGNIE